MSLAELPGGGYFKGPYVNTVGDRIWGEGLLHRYPGPAIERSDGTKEWWIDGQRHREDGPAVEHYGGLRRWFIKDIDITDDVEAWLRINQIALPFTPESRTMFKLTWVL